MAREADVTDMTDVLTLLVQLLTRFKEALGKLMEVALPIAVTRVHGLLGARHQLLTWQNSSRAAEAVSTSLLFEGLYCTQDELLLHVVPAVDEQ
jgi:hypothetical protein